MSTVPGSGAARDRTLVARLDSRDNALNALRLLFAVLVIVSHSWPVGGFGEEPALGNLKLGTFAVGGFFVVSGYLVSQSRERSRAWSYAWRRLRRIFPGYWVCLVVTAFGFAVVAGLTDGGWNLRSAVGYLWRNFLMIWDQGRVGATLAGVPLDGVWNGSLWTLRYELWCYIAVGLCYSLPVFRRRAWLTLSSFVLCTAATLVLHATAPSGRLFNFVFLLTFFLAGAVLYKFADRIPVDGRLAALATAVLIVVSLTGYGRQLAPLPLAYAALWAGISAPSVLKRIGRVNDFSYGTYLYAFPVQQSLVLLGLHHAGPWIYVPVAVLATAPFAAASWFFVERPANRVGVPFLDRTPTTHLLPKRRRTIDVPAEPVTARDVEA
ncbi:acyltransferase [Tersicoccus sp. Bi-70]|uniref:acyltransferase family protein n=1 Tax=Tersicoccus sp. Bi-70 TaxID=1897634 RepID=UPI0009769C98|nr:acyltransferase [Tersicoccus sp. Bi-70]OMH31363.1 hypothetical protein BGP79_10125 [Tersicoccus sp. Bi-70]